MVIDQGSGAVLLGARFVKPDGRTIGILDHGDVTADAAIGDTARLVIDVSGGRAPYTRKANFDGANHDGAVHDISLGSTTSKLLTC